MAASTVPTIRPRKLRYSPNMNEKQLVDSAHELWSIKTEQFLSSEVKICIQSLQNVFKNLYPRVKEARPNAYFISRAKAEELEQELAHLLPIEQQRYEEAFATREIFSEMVTAVLIRRYITHFSSEDFALLQAHAIFNKISKDIEKSDLWQGVVGTLRSISLYGPIEPLMGMLMTILGIPLRTIQETFSSFYHYRFGFLTIDKEILREQFDEVERHLTIDQSMAEQGFIMRDGCQDEGLKREILEAIERARETHSDKLKEAKANNPSGCKKNFW